MLSKLLLACNGNISTVLSNANIKFGFWLVKRKGVVKLDSCLRYRDYFMVGECVRLLFTSCEGSLNERVSAANE